MKRIMCVLLIGMLVFTMACDKEDEDAGCLLKKITHERELIKEEVYLEYNNNRQLVKIYNDIEGDASKVVYEYDEQGRLIAVIEYEENEDFSRTNYAWTDDSLEMINQNKDDKGEWVYRDYKHIFQINGNGEIVKEEEYNKFDGVWVKHNDYAKMTWTEGNNTKEEGYYRSGKKSTTLDRLLNRPTDKRMGQLKSISDNRYVTTIMEYDNKINVVGEVGIIAGIHGLNENNELSSKRFYEGETGTDVYEDIYVYEYNEKGYPTKVTNTYGFGEDINTSIVLYEYDCNE